MKVQVNIFGKGSDGWVFDYEFGSHLPMIGDSLVVDLDGVKEYDEFGIVIYSRTWFLDDDELRLAVYARIPALAKKMGKATRRRNPMAKPKRKETA